MQVTNKHRGRSQATAALVTLDDLWALESSRNPVAVSLSPHNARASVALTDSCGEQVCVFQEPVSPTSALLKGKANNVMQVAIDTAMSDII